MSYWAIYDADHVNEKPIFGIFESEETARENCLYIAADMADEVLCGDPAETGMTIEDRDWLINDCLRSLDIQEIKELNCYSF